ncbi:hypothetical protein ACFVMC_05545 [Nocardia sp. NPDC127579]|uniref:hypothetical protein n=1 Tax=Nocardia sp. NPDC127579 TaxID=3345402 RepID=UPI00362831FF
MTSPLAYPAGVTIGALAVCTVWAPFATSNQVAALATVALLILCYTAFRAATAFGVLPSGLPDPITVRVRRIRQEHRLVSRSWLEVTSKYTDPLWLPVYFDPALLSLIETDAASAEGVIRAGELRVYPSGRARGSEPPGRLIDNPSRPDPESAALARVATRWRRRLLLDAQPAVAAPFAALLWVYVDGGGLPAFTGACCVAFAAAVWLSAIRGSDPS